MDDWNDDDEDSMDESMQEPVAKRSKRNRDGTPTHLDIETENVKQKLDALKVADESSDDEFGGRGDGDMELTSAEVKDAKRMVMNSAKKVKERARRGKMADSVRSLRALVPGCADEKKVNQSQVLANTVTYITKVQAQMAQLQRELESLKSQVSSPSSRSDTELTSISKGFAFAPAKNTALSASRQRQSSNSRNAALSSSIFASSSSSASPSSESKSTISRPILKITGSAAGAPPTRVRANRGGLGGAPLAIDPVSPPVPPNSEPHTNCEKVPTVPLFGAHSTSPESYAMSPYVPFVPFFSSKVDPTVSPSSANPGIKSSSSNTANTPMINHTLQAPSTPQGFGGLTPTDLPPLGASPLTSVSFMTQYSFSGEDLGPELPAEWGQSSGVVGGSHHHHHPSVSSRTESDPYQDAGMLMDDIEEVGSWPLYHANSGAPTGVYDPYTGTTSTTTTTAALDTMGYPAIHHSLNTVQQTPQMQQRMPDSSPSPEAHPEHENAKPSAMCECGERPVY